MTSLFVLFYELVRTKDRQTDEKAGRKKVTKLVTCINVLLLLLMILTFRYVKFSVATVVSM